MKLFGFELKKKDKTNLQSFAPPAEEAGVQTIVSAGSHFGHYLDMSGDATKSESELLMKYRQAAAQPECDSAISEIVNESISTNETGSPVALRINDITINEDVKKDIVVEFEKILSLLDFNANGLDIFRNWYIDGKLYYHLMIDENDTEKGIQEIRYIDPVHIRKVREVSKETDRETGAELQEIVAEYFVYSPNYNGLRNSVETTTSGSMISGVKIKADSIVYANSGVLDPTRKFYVSAIHKALKAMNQLRMLEDAMVIYRYSRAPERRIFYIDVGNLAKGKAEEHVRSVMANYRNKMVYDITNGEIKDDRRHMSMLEDFFLPRSAGSGRGTEITTLPGGDGMDQTDHLKFFRKNLYMCLNVPISRLESESSYSFGKPSEAISREEIKFQRYISALRKKFSQLFLDILKVQLILTRVIDEGDWKYLREKISVDFLQDNYFTELKELEIMKERLEMVDKMQPLVGKYYSDTYIRKHVLRQSDDMIVAMAAEIEAEKGVVKVSDIVDANVNTEATPEGLKKDEEDLEDLNDTKVETEQNEESPQETPSEEAPTEEAPTEEQPELKEEETDTLNTTASLAAKQIDRQEEPSYH